VARRAGLLKSTEEFGGLPYTRPRWDGAPLGGKTILLHAEQGAGDTLLFARYARLVKRRGGTVVLACPKALVPLLSTCPGIDRLVAAGEPPPAHHCHAPLSPASRTSGPSDPAATAATAAAHQPARVPPGPASRL
jgi:hypothetical protein